MGWWKVSGTENIIGDGPLESLEGAISDVIAQYQSSFKRRPTRAEWEALLHAVLGSATSEERTTDEGIITKVQLELK